ncbi:MAG TPA: PGPGW domain-containing protein [Verrucomicrobiae bacterium]
MLKKTLVALVGGSLLLAGVALLVLPGPAFVVIPAALAILAIEFVWARRWLAWLRERLKKLVPNNAAKARARNLDSRITTQPQP